MPARPKLHSITRETFDIDVATILSDAVLQADADCLEEYMYAYGDPNIRLISTANEYSTYHAETHRGGMPSTWPVFGQHALGFLVTAGSGLHEESDIARCVAALLAPVDREYASDVQYERDCFHLSPADHAAICPYPEVGAAVIIDYIKQRGLHEAGQMPLFIPNYEHLYLMSMADEFEDLVQNAYAVKARVAEQLNDLVLALTQPGYDQYCYTKWRTVDGMSEANTRYRQLHGLIDHIRRAAEQWHEHGAFPQMDHIPDWRKRQEVETIFTAYRNGEDTVGHAYRIARALRVGANTPRP